MLVSPLCVRPLPGAPVSMRLTWDKVTPRLKLGSYHIRNAARLLARGGDPLAPVLNAAADMPGALEKLARELVGSKTQ